MTLALALFVAAVPLDERRLGELFGLRDGGSARDVYTRVSTADSFPWQLLGTLEARWPADSLAAVLDLRARRVRSVRMGDALGSAMVLRIARGQVWILVDGTERHLTSVDTGVLTHASVHAPRTKRPDTVSAFAERNGQTIVPRRIVESVLANPEPLARQVRIVPAFADGGVRVTWVQPGSDIEHLGLQAGDVLLRVNRRSLTSLENALGALQELEAQQRFQLDVLRDGRTVSMRYSVE